MLTYKNTCTKIFVLLFSVCWLTGIGQKKERGAIEIGSRSNFQNTHAIIVGISDYNEVQGLQFAHIDAMNFADILHSSQQINIDTSNLTVLLNSEATNINVGAAFNRIYKNTLAGDRVYFYFAGHGDIEIANPGNNGLLLLYNAPKSSYNAFGADYLPVSELRKFSQSLINKNVEVIIIVDACRSGKLAGGKEGIANTTAALSEQWSNEIKVLSCQPDELSLEGEQWGAGQGLFTYYLCRGLAGLADIDDDEQINLLELENYLEDNVIKDAAPSYQTPFTTGNKRFILAVVNLNKLNQFLGKKENDHENLTFVNSKSRFEIIDDTLRLLVNDFDNFIAKGNLIHPDKYNAIETFYKIEAYNQNENYTKFLQRNLAAACQEKAMNIIVPIMKQEKFNDLNISEIELGAKELEVAISLLGNNHYVKNSLVVRQLFLESYALCEKYRRNVHTNLTDGKQLLDTAIIKLQYAIKVDSNLAYPYFQLGWIFNILGCYDQSTLVHKKYIELVPNNKRAYNNLGYLYDGLGEYDSAILYYKKSISLDSSYAKSYNNLGLSYYLLNIYDTAVYYLNEATIIDPGYADAFYNLGNAYLAKWDLDLAKKSLNKVLEIDPIHCYSLYSFACIYSVENDKKKALEYLENSLACGFTEFDHIDQDTDLNNIRNESKFKDLIKKYSNKK